MAQHLCSFVSVPCVLPSSGFGTAFARPTVNYSLTLCHSARLPVRAMMPAPADSSCSPRRHPAAPARGVQAEPCEPLIESRAELS